MPPKSCKGSVPSQQGIYCTRQVRRCGGVLKCLSDHNGVRIETLRGLMNWVRHYHHNTDREEALLHPAPRLKRHAIFRCLITIVMRRCAITMAERELTRASMTRLHLYANREPNFPTWSQ